MSVQCLLEFGAQTRICEIPPVSNWDVTNNEVATYCAGLARSVERKQNGDGLSDVAIDGRPASGASARRSCAVVRSRAQSSTPTSLETWNYCTAGGRRAGRPIHTMIGHGQRFTAMTPSIGTSKPSVAGPGGVNTAALVELVVGRHYPLPASGFLDHTNTCVSALRSLSLLKSLFRDHLTTPSQTSTRLTFATELSATSDELFHAQSRTTLLSAPPSQHLTSIRFHGRHDITTY